jgi:lipopolysaccharide biosynthesis glycosyltransferase
LAEEINIAFGTNNVFVPQVAAAIASIVRHAPSARLRFIILHEGVPSQRRAGVQAVAPSARFFWAGVGDDDIPPYEDKEHFSRPILYRLGLERLAPSDCRRVIYIDSDVVILEDIRKLWNCSLEGKPIGAVIDHLISPKDFAERWGLPPQSPGYFNSGLLMMDLDQVRSGRILSTAIEFLTHQGAGLTYADQDALNFAFWGRWQPLPPTWNVQRNMVIASIVDKLPPDLRFHDKLPALVHYTGSEKPWVPGGYHPWSWLYWDSLARTPFFDEMTRMCGVGRLQRMLIWLRWMRRRPWKGAGHFSLPR